MTSIYTANSFVQNCKREAMLEATEKNVLYGPVSLEPTPEESLGIQIYNSLSTFPTQKVFIDAFTEKIITAADLLQSTCKLAQSLSNCGYNTNDIIAICSENNANFFLPAIAALYNGICCAAISRHYGEQELLHALGISKPKIVFCSNKCVQKFVNIKGSTPYVQRIVVFNLKEKISGVEHFDEFVARNCNAALDVGSFRPIDVDTRTHLAIILCSSGTTGLPKGVMITHRNISHLASQAKDIRFHKNLPNATFLATVPFFHAYGFTIALANIIHRQKIVVLESFQGDLFLEIIQKYKISNLAIVPPIAVFLAKSPLVQQYDLSSVQEISCGGASLGKDIQESVRKIFRLDRVLIIYGLTETTLAVVKAPFGANKSGSCGKVIAGMAMKVRDVETGENLPAGKEGEICFKGEMVMKGYFANEEATKNSLSNGWFRTGDLGYYDEAGFFFIVDRLKELIKYKGYQVAPAELEAVLIANPKIKDAAVVGIPDENAGELPCAFVVRQTGVEISENEVKAIVAAQLSHQKHLRGGVLFVDEIPKNASGKILRRLLRSTIKEQT